MVHLLLAVIYLAFISLGLPDSLLGSAWPSMYPQMNVPVSFAGIIFMIISAGTVVSSLQSDRLTKLLGTGRITAISIAMTAVALFGFSLSNSFWQLCLWAIPYGLGAGSIDAALNNYVALNYKSSHMSWLHCMWGVGTLVGPNIMGYILTGGGVWNSGYRIISIVQLVITAVIIFSLPLWKNGGNGGESPTDKSVMPLRQIISVPGVKEVIITFFCYCALEQTAMLWAGSYMVLHNGITKETAAGLASLLYIGITAGRMINGFLTFKLTDKQTIIIGEVIIAFGAVSMLIPLGNITTIIGLVLVGLGCAPIYPGIIHSTPEHFGADKSQALIGVQMASAYIGNILMPPLFGIIANHITVSLLPVYLLLLLVLMAVMYRRLISKTAKKEL